MKPLFVIACSGAKLDRAAPARELYTSQLFRKARAYAELHGADWLILSALHGVVEPDRVIEPYDQRMPTTKKGRAAWRQQVRTAMHKHRERRIVALAGQDYLGWTGGELAGFDDVNGRAVPRYVNAFNVERPLQGMGIGHQLQYLTNGVQQ
jgi:hypothetical protein